MKQNFDFTMVCAGQRAFINSWLTHGNAFTMAEILLSLTIIGVVAAITLPSLTGNINERTWNTQRKALYARFSQALALMPSLNGYGNVVMEEKDEEGNITQSAVDTAAETFITVGLTKVMKINNICNTSNISDCGFPSKITVYGGSTINDFASSYDTLETYNSYFKSNLGIKYNTKNAAFETQNGESILVYYNPTCVSSFNEERGTLPRFMCVNFIYDLNGIKGPNTMGKDMGFITAIHPTDPIIVSPQPLATDSGSKIQSEAGAVCKKLDNESRLPNFYELSAMFYNKSITNINFAAYGYWSSTLVPPDKAKWVYTADGCQYGSALRSVNGHIRCVKQ